jgi:pentose-5-phosphate-3-epimerase
VILASIRAVDPTELGVASERLLAAGADELHVDVQLLVARPEDYLPLLAGAGRVRAARALLPDRVRLEVDGGADETSAGAFRAAGADDATERSR